jgi:mannitol-specific phosphotransferase system IIBC component
MGVHIRSQKEAFLSAVATTGTIAPVAPASIAAEIALTSTGAVALTQITAGEEWDGKTIVLRNANADPTTDTITVTDGATLILGSSANFVINNADDRIKLRKKAGTANTFIEESRVNAG